MAPPSTTPGGNPVMALPGLSAIFPIMVVGPVLVIVEAPKMATSCAAPSGTVWALTGNKGAASSAETISATVHAGYGLGTRVWLAAVRAAFLTRSQTYIDLR